MTIALMAFVCVGFSACGSDDDDNGGGNNEIINRLVGTWQRGSETLIINANRTGNLSGAGTAEFYKSKDEYKKMSENGSFKVNNPYKVRKEDGEVWFLIDFTYTSGEASGWTIDWEIGYDEDEPDYIYVEGYNKYTRVK